MALSIKKFLKNSNFGKFEYLQKTGRSTFRIDHSIGVNGTKFFEKFFEIIFKNCLNDYHFDIVSDQNHVCVIFR